MSETINARAPALGAEEAALKTALPARTSGAALGQILRRANAIETLARSADIALDAAVPASAPVAALYGRGGRAALHQVMWR